MTPTEARAMYRLQMDMHGEPIKLRRGYDGVECDTRAIVRGFQPEQLVGGIGLGHRSVLVLTEDIPATWPGPPVKNDRVLWDGRLLTVTAVDSATRRVAGETVAFELVASGA